VFNTTLWTGHVLRGAGQAMMAMAMMAMVLSVLSVL
jgi:3-oxoacyl-(acyl-carrier-protein) synthase